MLDFLYQLDLNIFYFINHTIANPVFDKFFVFITDIKNWFLAYVILWLILFFKGGRLGKIAAIGVLFLIAASDQISSSLLKSLFERVRPCNALSDVRLLVGSTSSFSFPSSHAVNNFAVAVYFSVLFPRYKWILLISAALIAFSRPYVGVHYPSDILGGALIGSFIGYIFAYIVKKIEFKYNISRSRETEKLERITFK